MNTMKSRQNTRLLLLSCGTRNKIVQFFRAERNNDFEVYAADCSTLAPALYDADKFFIVPRMNDSGYLDHILAICRDNAVDAVLSLIDPELSLLAQHRQDFLDIGTIPFVSDYQKVELCYNKYAMYLFLVQNGFDTITSYIDKDTFYCDVEAGKIQFPVFIKPVRGSASIDTHKVDVMEEVDLLFAQHENMMIQQFMDGEEYGADVYIDWISGEPVSIFTKQKIKMRAGETDKAVSVKDDKLFNLIERFVVAVGLRGIIDIDIFKMNDKYYISEVNPRFGGGYPHAYGCGVNIPGMIINNLKGVVNEKQIGNYENGFYMMKYNEVKVTKLV